MKAIKRIAPVLGLLVLALSPACGQVFTNATKLNGRPLCKPGTPSDGVALVWNGTTKCWDVQSAPGAGATGPAGAAGAAATVTVGTTTTGAAGSSAAVSNSGSTSAAVLNFTIPTGPTGPAGPTGPPGGALVMTTGSGAPSANCTAPTSANLAEYSDQTNGDLWFCYATNSWKKVISTTNTGAYQATGATGTAPTAPASGNVTCYFSSTSNTQICLDSSGNAFTMVKGASARVANQFMTHVDASGIQHQAAIAPADVIGGFSGTCNSTTLLGGDGICQAISSAFSAITSATNTT